MVVCKQDAISVSRDKNGFESIGNPGSVTGCGMCTKVCPLTASLAKEIDRERQLYMAYSTRLDVPGPLLLAE